MTATPSARRSFNPRARKGRDSRGRPSRCSSRCFNPRARKGRDTSLSKYTASPTCFNPRARKGRDGWRGAVHGPGRVSIHAPARGATVAEFALAIVSLFQSTRPQGARLLDEMDIAIEQLFQSTRPQGARRSESPSSPAPTRFNPRARKGRDHVWRHDKHGRPRVSIHAPARGATLLLDVRGRLAFVSIHAPARGATAAIYRVRNMHRGFNPRARKGRDPWVFLSKRCQGCFNPRARKGRDLGDLPYNVSIQVSIHAPARGATILVLLNN